MRHSSLWHGGRLPRPPSPRMNACSATPRDVWVSLDVLDGSAYAAGQGGPTALFPLHVVVVLPPVCLAEDD
jgi:hypothetical protein